MNMLKNIKYILNNENGGPSLEYILLIANSVTFALIITKQIKPKMPQLRNMVAPTSQYVVNT